MGMAAAVAAFGDRGQKPTLVRQVRWFLPVAVLAGLTLAPSVALEDALVGAATSSFLIFGANGRGSGSDGGFKPRSFGSWNREGPSRWGRSRTAFT